MHYGIKFIGEHQLPEGTDWMFIQSPNELCLFIKQDRVTPDNLMAAWAAFRQMAGSAPPAGAQSLAPA